MSIKRTAYDTVALQYANETMLATTYESPNILLAGPEDLYEDQNVAKRVLVAVRDAYGEKSDMGFVEAQGAAQHPILINSAMGSIKSPPIQIGNPSRKVNKIVIDIRPMSKYNKNGDKLYISNLLWYEFERIRAALNALFVFEGATTLKTISNMGMKAYIKWVGGAIWKACALDPKEVAEVTALTALWYESLFTDEETFDSSVYLPLSSRIGERGFHIPQQTTVNFYETLDGRYPKDIRAFVEWLKINVKSARLDKLTPNTLVALIIRSWFGANSEEICAVALEHPPTWFTLMYFACQDRTYRKTAISQILESSQFNNDKKQFLLNVKDIVGNGISGIDLDTDVLLK